MSKPGSRNLSLTIFEDWYFSSELAQAAISATQSFLFQNMMVHIQFNLKLLCFK